jgi:hypothetical protein
MDYSNLSIEGYACLQDFFLLRNLKTKNLILLGSETKESVQEAFNKTSPENGPLNLEIKSNNSNTEA